MRNKHFTAIALIALFLTAALCSFGAAAETQTKIFTLQPSGDTLNIKESPLESMFWETPLLGAGQSRDGGEIRIVNNSSKTVSFRLKSVELPYDDAAMLNYLNHMILTIKDGNTVVYNGSYAHVNDQEGGLKLEVKQLQPGKDHSWTVSIHCPYTFSGKPVVAKQSIRFLFESHTEETVMRNTSNLWIWVVMGVAVALVVVVMVISAVRKK